MNKYFMLLDVYAPHRVNSISPLITMLLPFVIILLIAGFLIIKISKRKNKNIEPIEKNNVDNNK